jgi:hypothetical protein
MENPGLKTRHKIGITLVVMTSLGFLIAALVTFLREGDWPAKYISAALTLLAAMFIAFRRRAARLRKKHE